MKTAYCKTNSGGKMKKTIVFTVLLLSFSLSCSKKEITVPDCIKSLISEFGFCVGSGTVGQYSFQGKIVYLFDPGTCGADMMAPVYNESCECIGSLGGIAGINEVNGVPFSSNAKLLRTIWKDGSFTGND